MKEIEIIVSNVALAKLYPSIFQDKILNDIIENVIKAHLSNMTGNLTIRINVNEI